MKRVFVLIMAVVCIGIFAGCANSTAQSKGPEKIEETVEENGRENVKKDIVKKIDEKKPSLPGLKKDGKIHTGGESGTFQTNLTAKREGGGLQIDFTLKNISDKEVVLSYPSGQEYDYWIYNDRNELVYHYAKDKFFTLALHEKFLRPGGAIHHKIIWDYTDQNGKKVEESEFHIVFRITAKPLDNEGKPLGKQHLEESLTIPENPKK